MKYRWTIKELQEVTNKKLILALINERTSELNGYCPLAERLNRLAKWVEANLDATPELLAACEAGLDVAKDVLSDDRYNVLALSAKRIIEAAIARAKGEL